MSRSIDIAWFSDILCVWAYVAEERIAEIGAQFGDSVRVTPRWFSLFGDTTSKIGEGWADRGGFPGYAAHVAEIAARFPHVTVDPRAWRDVRPLSSLPAHLHLSAVATLDTESGQAFAPAFATALRRAFFADARDIASRSVLDSVAADVGIDPAAIAARLDSGAAHASLAKSQASAEKLRLEGSPTIVLNEGRQKLYGNVGFRVIEANIRELLRDPDPGQASWC